jgi:hypothetical protein
LCPGIRTEFRIHRQACQTQAQHAIKLESHEGLLWGKMLTLGIWKILMSLVQAKDATIGYRQLQAGPTRFCDSLRLCN